MYLEDGVDGARSNLHNRRDRHLESLTGTGKRFPGNQRSTSTRLTVVQAHKELFLVFSSQGLALHNNKDRSAHGQYNMLLAGMVYNTDSRAGEQGCTGL